MLVGMTGIIPTVPSTGTETYDVAGSYSFTVPVGVTSIDVTLVGGSGGGASGWGTSYVEDKQTVYVKQYGGDGGSGAQATKTISVVGGTDVTIVVGSGGAGGTATGSYNGSYDAGDPGEDSYVEYASSEEARADAGEGGLKTSDGSGGLASASSGDTTTDGIAGDGGAGGFGPTNNGSPGSDGSVVVEW